MFLKFFLFIRFLVSHNTSPSIPLLRGEGSFFSEFCYKKSSGSGDVRPRPDVSCSHNTSLNLSCQERRSYNRVQLALSPGRGKLDRGVWWRKRYYLHTRPIFF